MRVMDLFPGKYLKAADLRDKRHDVTIVRVDEGTVGDADEVRPILFVEEFEKGICLNVGNSERIIDLYGDESDDWTGQKITIYPSECDLRGKTVPCIRVSPNAPKAAAKARPAKAAPVKRPAKR